ncbi:MAG: hypothetical protein GY834_00030 [Bacteroidetes bacterium]|nr:hypothetical protein [Bacteroidota bacterium]
MNSKTEKSNPEPKPEDINEEWDEISQIKTFEKYQNQRQGVFSSNIERWAEFLEMTRSVFVKSSHSRIFN